MLAWPGSDWGESPAEAPPLAADWRAVDGEVRHTFTHFHLRLALRCAEVPLAASPGRGAFIDGAEFRPDSLPTVMRKVWALASSALPG